MKILFLMAILAIYLVSGEIALIYRQNYVAKPYDLMDQAMVYVPILNTIVFLLIVFASVYYVLTHKVEGLE